MPTPPSPEGNGEAKHVEASPADNAAPPRQEGQRRSKVQGRPRGSGTTGSLSATNPNRRRSGKTGSLSATNPNRKRTGKTGTLSGTSSGAIRGGATPTSKKGGVPKHSAYGSRGNRPTVIALVAVVVALALVVGGFFVVRSLLHPYEGARVEDGQSVTVTIPEGADGARIIQQLLDAGVIHSSKDFRRAVNDQNADQSLRCGTYTFTTGMDPAQVVTQLVSGPNTAEGQLQVPEGLTVQQTAELVESSLGIPATEFVDKAKASLYVSDYSFLKEAGNDSLEGFLYPKTYDFGGKQPSAEDVIRMMLSQFQTELAAVDVEGARKDIYNRYGLNATMYDLIKIASIIEEEARNEEDRPKVASVFYNRLRNNMALQSDATMGYVTGGTITAEDLKSSSPYNTYMYKGLPPTPISSPSEWAIDAAMHPSETDYLFFFIIESENYSNHTFTKTFEEHDAAYQAALAEQAAAGTPAGTATGTTTGTTTGTAAGTPAGTTAANPAGTATGSTAGTTTGTATETAAGTTQGAQGAEEYVAYEDGVEVAEEPIYYESD